MCVTQLLYACPMKEMQKGFTNKRFFDTEKAPLLGKGAVIGINTCAYERLQPSFCALRWAFRNALSCEAR